ncbi:MAG: DUF2817 domain-containing protein [Candidatus Marinimicrobia bacterium]|nr:DUF2817 domain-containing protein [Candidatus Neomarinimicrobiota bacterium]MCF7904531.1 DUF2817 domain-containing protein [Candidatus Neomarinimicrobiota bacterium]
MNTPKHLISTLFILIIFVLISSCTAVKKEWAHRERQKLGASVYEQIRESEIPWRILTQSVEGRDIYLTEMGQGDSLTLIFGGFHGSEISGVQLVHQFAEHLYAENIGAITSRVVIVPVLNPDGLVVARRQNANGIDINRNFPTENWDASMGSGRNSHGTIPGSEPETQIAMELLEIYMPDRIISVHAPLRVVNYDGPAAAVSRKMAEYNHYPVDSDIGYATPGSFGTYAGKERNIPTITLELPPGLFTEEVWLTNRDALLAAIKF